MIRWLKATVLAHYKFAGTNDLCITEQIQQNTNNRETRINNIELGVHMVSGEGLGLPLSSV